MLQAGASRALVNRARQPFARVYHFCLQLPSAPPAAKRFQARVQASAMTLSASGVDVQHPSTRPKNEHRCQDRGVSEARSPDVGAFPQHNVPNNGREIADTGHHFHRRSRSRSRSPRQLDDIGNSRGLPACNGRKGNCLASQPLDTRTRDSANGAHGLHYIGNSAVVTAYKCGDSGREVNRGRAGGGGGGYSTKVTERGDTSPCDSNCQDDYGDPEVGGRAQDGDFRDVRVSQRHDSDVSPVDSPNLQASRRRHVASSPRSRSRSRSRSHSRNGIPVPSPERIRDSNHSPPHKSTSKLKSKSDSRSASRRRSPESGKRRRSRSPEAGPPLVASRCEDKERDRERDRDGSRKDRSRRDDRGRDVQHHQGDMQRDRVIYDIKASTSVERHRDGGGRGERERDRERRREREGERDWPDPERSRSRSRSRTGDRDLERDREWCRDNGLDKRREKEISSHGGAVTVPVTEQTRRDSADGSARSAAGLPPAARAAGVERPVLEPPASASPRVVVGGSSAAIGNNTQRGGSGSGSRLLVSFADELDEEGGAGTGSLAASTAKRFLREEAAARMANPARTITTTASSSLPLPLLTGTSAAMAAPSSPMGLHLFGHQHLVTTAPLQQRPSSVVVSSLHGTSVGTGGIGAAHHASAVGAMAAASMPAADAAAAGMALGELAVSRSRGGSPEAIGGRTLGRVVFGTASARCARPYMEDRHCIVQCLRPLSSSGQPLQDGVQRCLAAIYDGHNGTRAADTAAARLHMLLAADAALRTHTGELAPPAAMAAEEAAIGAALRRCFRRLDDEILAEARADGARDGATALLVMRLSDTLYAAHAGDSRAVLSRRGHAVRLTEDHKPHLPAEKARVEAAGGRVDFQRCWRVIVEPREGRLGSGLAVSRSLGDLDFKEPRRFVECEPDVRRLMPQPGDNLVVMGSDGLWDVMSDQEAVDCANTALLARRGPLTSTSPAFAYRDEDAQYAAQALLDAAQKRGTADNVTVIVMLLQWD
ncbi:hypothetical protein Vretimale_9141 [Volvox reticuliferus]|uniref:PPM-type phosphatase domain-containing protein n=1 Tax=Volvox reticuliferus TaxID=1737510 RepID=A0A8J4GC66_9CHLO|nr:hypothetical protein Vretifemale_9810 [Volvox reticuliferus]GIM04586.1 hypothetical protein Vretimale_9141 [Volvox reticuliferus]